jgi:membrane protein YqaA with SNARE-associated domain
MKHLLTWAQTFAMAWGGPGLFFVAFLDASFLSLPEINDLLVIWLVMRHKEAFVYYASMATLGSLTGCLVLYAIARLGGEAVLRKRLKQRRIESGMETFRRYGLLALLVPAILPPPMPFKVFVLLAGIAEVPTYSFTLAIAIGRGLRYFALSLLAVFYGETAVRYMRENSSVVATVLAALVLAGGVSYVVWRKRKNRS